MREMLVVSAALLAGCAPAASQPPVASPGTTPATYTCRGPDFPTFTGRTATSEVGTELLRASGARVIRWVQPGMMVTMDYRMDRLTVRLDAQNRILSANCG